MFYEILRWISLGLSLFALGVSSYSCWFAYKVNGRLRENNQSLRADNLRLLRVNKEYEAVIMRLRERLKKDEGDDNDNG
jgi:hypothetical protein